MIVIIGKNVNFKIKSENFDYYLFFAVSIIKIDNQAAENEGFEFQAYSGFSSPELYKLSEEK